MTWYNSKADENDFDVDIEVGTHIAKEQEDQSACFHIVELVQQDKISSEFETG